MARIFDSINVQDEDIRVIGMQTLVEVGR